MIHLRHSKRNGYRKFHKLNQGMTLRFLRRMVFEYSLPKTLSLTTERECAKAETHKDKIILKLVTQYIVKQV